MSSAPEIAAIKTENSWSLEIRKQGNFRTSHTNAAKPKRKITQETGSLQVEFAKFCRKFLFLGMDRYIVTPLWGDGWGRMEERGGEANREPGGDGWAEVGVGFSDNLDGGLPFFASVGSDHFAKYRLLGGNIMMVGFQRTDRRGQAAVILVFEELGTIVGLPFDFRKVHAVERQMVADLFGQEGGIGFGEFIGIAAEAQAADHFAYGVLELGQASLRI